MGIADKLWRWLLGPERPLQWYEIENRTYKDGEMLSEEEAEIMQRNICPDCGEILLKGPSGGASVNMLCSNEDCGSKYNSLGYFGGERINDSKGSLTIFKEND